MRILWQSEWTFAASPRHRYDRDEFLWLPILPYGGYIRTRMGAAPRSFFRRRRHRNYANEVLPARRQETKQGGDLWQWALSLSLSLSSLAALCHRNYTIPEILPEKVTA